MERGTIHLHIKLDEIYKAKLKPIKEAPFRAKTNGVPAIHEINSITIDKLEQTAYGNANLKKGFKPQVKKSLKGILPFGLIGGSGFTISSSSVNA